MQVGNAVEGAVAADDDEVLYTALQEVLRRSLHDLGLSELVRSARTEDGAAGVDAVGNAAVRHLDDIVFDEPDIAVTHAVDFIAFVERIADRSPYARIHAGRVAAAGQDREFFGLFGCILCHNDLRIRPFICRISVRAQAHTLVYYIRRK